MTLLLDHIFVIVESADIEVDSLTEFGFVEGSPSSHPGQGTANRRFYVGNFMLEFLYISDVDEAKNGAGSRLNILERSTSPDASPFGLIARSSGADETPAFPHWRYSPEYFDGSMCFYVGENSALRHEPLCVCMPSSLPKPAATSVDQNDNQWALSQIEIQTPLSDCSSVLQAFAAMEPIVVTPGKPHRLLLRFNDGSSRQSRDINPHLPVTIQW